MEKRILLNEPMFTALVKKGFLLDESAELRFSTRDLALLCQGKIVEMQHAEWGGFSEYRFALADIGKETINEILKRSPIYADLAGNFENYK